MWNWDLNPHITNSKAHALPTTLYCHVLQQYIWQTLFYHIWVLLTIRNTTENTVFTLDLP